MYFFNKCLNYSSTLGSNQAEAPGALFLNGMQNDEMRGRLRPKDVYNPSIISKTRENALCKVFMELNCQLCVGFCKETTQVVSLEKSFEMPGLLRPFWFPQRCWFLGFKWLVCKPWLRNVPSGKRCLLNSGFEIKVYSKSRILLFGTLWYLRVIISVELGTNVLGMFLISGPSFYHGAGKSVQKLPSHPYLKIYFR